MTDESLFAAALDAADPGAFLAAHCPDPDARTRVEALLAAHAAAGGFLEPPTRTVAPTDDPDVTATHGGRRAAVGDEVLAFLAPSPRPGALGRLDHYDVLEVLGAGGFGTVLKAFDDRLHRVVAVKVLAPQLAAVGSARARFLREARTAAPIHDPHVVNVFAVSDDDAPVPYLVMEFVAGQTLQQKLDRAGPLAPAEVLRIGSQAAAGLAAAHAHGLIHRDIKPANVLLENGVERVKIADFGLARAADDASLSQSGVIAGTPMFMSPEQARGEPLDARSDLFSLGSVLYALCTGRPPFRADSTVAVLKRVVEDDPRPIREVNAAIPPWLADVVARLHAKKPEDRFASAREVADLLAAYLADLQQQGTVTARAGVAPPRPARAARRRWSPRVVATAVVMLGVLTVLFWGPLAQAVGYRLRHIRNEVVVEVEPADGVETYSLFRQDEGGALDPSTFIGPIDGRTGRTFTLPPGRYTVIFDPRPGWTPGQWEGKVYRAFGADDWSDPTRPILTVARGERVTVRMVMTEGRTAAPADADGWKTLFNGKDLTGWKTHPTQPGGWAVENGHLISRREAGYLFSERGDWQDFHLRAEVHVTEGGNSGVFFRTPFELLPAGGPGVFAPAGWYEADLFWGPVARPGRMLNLGETPETLATPNAWLTLEVIARGNRFQTRVNGQLAVDATDAKATFARGHFALQAFSPTTSVRFRKIEVREFPAAPPPAVAPFTPEQAKAHQEAWAKHLGVPVEFTNDLGMTFRLVPPGEYTHGSTAEQAAALRHELTRVGARAGPVGDYLESATTEAPPVRVRLTRPIYLAAREVEVRQFRRFVEATKHKTEAETGGGGQVIDPGAPAYRTDPKAVWAAPGHPTDDRHPVTQVSWNDAEAFCAWLAKADGVGARLPTEAEWEYAARAGSDGFNSFANSPDGPKRVVCEAAGPRPTGSLPANGFGLFDLEGNVWEWVGGWVRTDFAVAPLTDPAVAEPGGVQMFRGGGFPQPFCFCRPAARFHDVPDARTFDTGFRVALAGDLKAAATARKATPTAAGPLRDLVAAREKARAVAKPRFDAGILPPHEMHLADFDLADARARLAEAEGDMAALAARLADLLAAARSYRRVIADRVAFGALGADALAAADAKLAEARGRLAAAGVPEPPHVPDPAVAPFPEVRAKALQAEWADHLGVKVEMTGPAKMPFRLVPPGRFTMGADPGDDLAGADERPPHEVRITRPFYLGVHEATVGQFKEFVRETGHKTVAEETGGAWHLTFGAKVQWQHKGDFTWRTRPEKAMTDDHPVVALARADAEKFCAWLGTKDGAAYRLPTEAEWEYACRAGTTTRFSFGDAPDLTKANLGQPSANTKKVGFYPPNAFGFHDTHGNAGEWVRDHPRGYTWNAAADPAGPATGTHQVYRGGQWVSALHGSVGRASHRQHVPTGRAVQYAGFRVVREAGPGAK